MKLLVSMSILLAVFIIGSIVSARAAWPDYQKENVRAVPGDSLHPRSKSCTRTCCFHLGNLAIIRISGMDHYSPTTLRNSIECILKLDNARMFSIAWASLYKNLGDRQPKLILRNRKHLKKIPRMDERFSDRGMGRGRGSFSKSQQSHSDLGSSREATTGTFCFHSREDWFLRSNKSGNWPTGDPNSSYFQCRDLSALSLSSAPLYSQAHSADLRQCQISQSSRLEPFLYQISGPAPTSFFASVFTRTKSHRASLEDHPSKSNPQPLLSKYRKSRRSSCEPVYPMGTS